MDFVENVGEILHRKTCVQVKRAKGKNGFSEMGGARSGALGFPRPRRLRKFRKILRHKVHRVHLPGAAIEAVQGSGVGGEAECQFVGVQGRPWRP